MVRGHALATPGRHSTEKYVFVWILNGDDGRGGAWLGAMRLPPLVGTALKSMSLYGY